ncbi:hypothetical protein B9Z55_000513 [Caenorhabditis nigoni]|uniref:F-box domain-containing protein n=1 Tax=Caenorhabditis nigoni TaxID=1611254 RepID=A0A2G5VTS4_9PELO|nr:hypothetical protein B9Z55_000513 [Caenorhabditis nigoni]
MVFELENLTEKVENLSIDSIHNTNWCDIPTEIKLKCIEKLEFKERLSLRRTAKAERSLVDSQKIRFQRGDIYGWKYSEHLFFLLHREKECRKVFPRRFEDINEAFEFLELIRKVGVFENFSISTGDFFTTHRQFVTDDGLLSAKNIEFVGCNIDTVVAVLRKMSNLMESIKIDLSPTEYARLAEILGIPQVQNVPYWHIRNYHLTGSLHKVAQMWIDKKSKIGSTFQVSVYRNDSFNQFLNHFIDRIVSKNDRRVHIRTNVPDRLILLERGIVPNHFLIPYDIDFFRLIVISAEMKESEYEDDCTEWIRKVMPEIYDYYSEGPFEMSDDDY